MNERYSHADMDAALCIWEFAISCQARGDESVFDWLRGGEGTAAARYQCVALAKDCDRSYQDAYNLSYSDSFDWEFVPQWIRHSMAITEKNELTRDWIDYIGKRIYVDFAEKNRHV